MNVYCYIYGSQIDTNHSQMYLIPSSTDARYINRVCISTVGIRTYYIFMNECVTSCLWSTHTILDRSTKNHSQMMESWY